MEERIEKLTKALFNVNNPATENSIRSEIRELKSLILENNHSMELDNDYRDRSVDRDNSIED